MSFIKTVKSYPAKRGGGKTAFVLCGFGGSIWQTRRLLAVLRRAGYDVTAFDFSEAVLSTGDPAALPGLVDEMVALVEARAKALGKPILLVGISLGALISLNILRRSPLFRESVMITGGDIVKVAQRIYGPKVWPQSYDELARQWRHINIYSDPKELAGRRLLFVLPAKDKLIDPEDVRKEVQTQNNAGNHLVLLERHWFGHVGTIIEETILFPRRVLRYIRQVG
jgi:pimeloyl-ACP methyl ester carboxylesterase